MLGKSGPPLKNRGRSVNERGRQKVMVDEKRSKDEKRVKSKRAVTGGRIGLKEGEASGGFAVLIVRAFFARAVNGNTSENPGTRTRSHQLEYVWRCSCARVDSGNWDKLLCDER